MGWLPNAYRSACIESQSRLTPIQFSKSAAINRGAVPCRCRTAICLQVRPGRRQRVADADLEARRGTGLAGTKLASARARRSFTGHWEERTTVPPMNSKRNSSTDGVNAFPVSRFSKVQELLTAAVVHHNTIAQRRILQHTLRPLGTALVGDAAQKLATRIAPSIVLIISDHVRNPVVFPSRRLEAGIGLFVSLERLGR